MFNILNLINPPNFRTQPWLSELSRRRKLRLCIKYFERGATILEVGTGDGWFAFQLRAAGFNVTTLDLFPPADIIGNIIDWPTLGLKAASFDAIVALELIEHVDCLSSLSALCKKEGMIMLSSPHPNWDWLMKILEQLHLTQMRTSPHSHLIDFRKLPLTPIQLDRPMGIHQVGFFKNSVPKQ